MAKDKLENERKNNALKHGAFQAEFLIFEEDQDEFDQLHKGLVEDFKPSGSMEEALVLDLVKLYWRKRRVDQFYAREANWIQMAKTGAVHVERITEVARYLTKGQRCQDIWENVVPMLPENVQIDVDAKFSCPSEEYDDEWIKSLKDYILAMARQIEKIVDDYRHGSRFMGETAARLMGLSAKRIAIEERLDALIDRTLKRLAQVKAFKDVIASNNEKSPRKISAA
jgi:hypothetical protein